MRVRIGPDDARLLLKAIDREPYRKRVGMLSKLMRGYIDKGVPVWLWDETRELVRQAVESAVHTGVYNSDELPAVKRLYALKLMIGAKCTGPEVESR
jgi:hypothetical protein